MSKGFLPDDCYPEYWCEKHKVWHRAYVDCRTDFEKFFPLTNSLLGFTSKLIHWWFSKIKRLYERIDLK